MRTKELFLARKDEGEQKNYLEGIVVREIPVLILLGVGLEDRSQGLNSSSS